MVKNKIRSNTEYVHLNMFAEAVYLDDSAELCIIFHVLFLTFNFLHISSQSPKDTAFQGKHYLHGSKTVFPPSCSSSAESLPRTLSSSCNTCLHSRRLLWHNLAAASAAAAPCERYHGSLSRAPTHVNNALDTGHHLKECISSAHVFFFKAVGIRLSK